MNVRSEELDRHVVTLVATIEPSDYHEEYVAKLKESRKSLNLKGFRQGQVPMGLAERLLGPRIRLDVVQQKLDEAISGYLRAQGIQTYSRFLPNADQEAQGVEEGEGTFTFRMDVGVQPDFPEDLLPRMVVLLPEVDDAYVRGKLEEQRRHYAKERELDAVEPSCALRLRFAPQGEGEEASVERRVRYDDLAPSVQDLLRGKRAGDAVEVGTLEGFFSDADLQSGVFRRLPQDSYPLEGAMRISVVAVLGSELAAVDEAFYRTLAPSQGEEQDPADLDGWFARYRDRQQLWGEHMARVAASDAFLERIAAGWDFEVPDGFMRRMVESAQEGEPAPVSDEALSHYKAQLKRDAVRERLMGKFDMGALLGVADPYHRFLVAYAIRQRGLGMGFPPHFFDSVERAFDFGFSIYQAQMNEIATPVLHWYVAAWAAMQEVGVEMRTVPAGEYDAAAAAEYGGDAAE